MLQMHGGIQGMTEQLRSSAKQGILIGVLGSEYMVHRILHVIKSFPSFQPVAHVCKDDEEIVQLAEQLNKEVEVLFMTDPHSFRIVKERVRATVPIHYVPLTGTGLFKSLCSLLTKHKLDSVSIDSFSANVLKHLSEEATEMNIRIVGYDKESDVNSHYGDLIQFHQESYIKGRSNAALTAVRSIADRLTQLAIPNEWITPSDNDIVVALERALLSSETRKSKEAQIVVGMVLIDNIEELFRNSVSEHEVQKLRLDVHRMLLDYVESLDGYLTHLSHGEYLFFTTRGIFERETGGYKYIPLAADAQKLYGLSLSIGIGFGKSANHAGTNARTAQRIAKDAGGDACFIVREDQTYIGPLQMSDPIQFDLRLSDAELMKKLEEAGMSPAYLSRILAAVSRTGKLDYNVHELSAMLDITVRSTHRLLLQWMDGGFIQASEMKKIPRGRPIQMFHFSFLKEQMSEHGISLSYLAQSAQP
jgi:hypothetical protein